MKLFSCWSNLKRMFAAQHEKSFVPVFFKVSIDHLSLVTLSLEKYTTVFRKSMEKVWNFGSKNLYEAREAWRNKLAKC